MFLKHFFTNFSCHALPLSYICFVLSCCSWAQEFLNEENQGLDVLVDYLSVAHSAVT